MSRFRVFWIGLSLLIGISAAGAQIPINSGDHTFPKEGVVIERLETKIAFHSDGTYVRTQNSRVRIQSDAGVQEYGILKPPYQSSIESIEVIDVRVTKPDGTVIVTPLDQIQDAPFTVNGRAFEYSDLRQKHVAIKGLDVGDTLTTSIRWRVDKPLAPGQFWYSHWFLKTAVVLDEELEISSPKEREVKLKSEGVQPTTRQENNLKIYAWKTSNSDSQKLQKQSEALGYEAIVGLLPAPDVLISTFQSWDEVGHWYGNLQDEKIQITPEIKAKAAELTTGLVDEDAKLRAIYNYVSLRYHYVSLALGSWRYQPHAANEVLANQYGDCKDKHTLLATLLKAVGIQAYPALISSHTRIAEEVPSPGQFDHVITVVGRGNSWVWMDTTPEVTPLGYLANTLRGKPALVIAPNKVGFQNTPSSSSFADRYLARTMAKITEDGVLQAHVEAQFRGDDNELTYRYLFRRLPEAQWIDFAQKSFYGARIGGTITGVKASSPEKTDEPFTLEYDYTIRQFSVPDHKFAIPISPVNIPVIQDRDLDRKTPLWIGTVGEEMLESRIELPAGWSAAQPNPLNLKESFAEFYGDTEVNGNVLVTKRRLVIKANTITPDQLKSYKDFQKAVSDNQNLFIFLHASAGFPTTSPVSTPAAEPNTAHPPITLPVTQSSAVTNGVYRVGGGVSAPRTLYSPNPEYSDEARRAKYQGTCVLSLIIGSDGMPRDIRIARSLGMGLDEKAMEAVKQWRFQPAMKDGKPVAVAINIEVRFQL